MADLTPDLQVCLSWGLIAESFHSLQSSSVSCFHASWASQAHDFPQLKGKRDRRGDKREGQGINRNRNDSEETEEIKTPPSTCTCYKDSRHCPAVKAVSHRTRLGTRFQYGILGYTRVDWYEYWAPTVPGDELVRFRLECSTSMYEQSTDILGQARFVTVGTRFAKRFSYDCCTVPSTV